MNQDKKVDANHPNERVVRRGTSDNLYRCSYEMRSGSCGVGSFRKDEIVKKLKSHAYTKDTVFNKSRTVIGERFLDNRLDKGKWNWWYDGEELVA